MTEIRCPVAELADRDGDLPAIIGVGLTLSYRELDQRVSAASMRLSEAGCCEGDRIALHLPNSWRHVTLLLALFRIGAVACPLNTRIPPAGIRPLLHRIDCTKLVSSEAGLTESSREITVLNPERLARPDRSEPGHRATEEIRLGRQATVVFTSGSSGLPKAALHSYGNHYYSARSSNLNIRLGPGDRWLLNLPLCHVGGLGILFRCLLGGAAIVLPEKAEAAEVSIARNHVTHLSMVPTQLFRMLRDLKQPGRLEGLRAVLLGGAPLPAALLRQAYERGIPLYASYGLTEMASQVTTTPEGAVGEKRCTAGRSLRHCQVCIGSGDEILVRGETLFLGYVERERTHRAVDAEGWFPTGDLGRLDAEGYLTILGRKDNMFVSGGENIQPEEIEAALAELPDVAQALVVPVPDEEYGHRPIAFVHSEGAKLDPDAVREQLKTRLPSYKVPLAFYDLGAPTDAEQLKPQRASYQKLALELWHKGRVLQ